MRISDWSSDVCSSDLAIFIASADPLKGFVSLFLGLMITCVGMGNPTGYPRLTFGSDDLLGGLSLVPVMVGMFAVSEVLRYAVNITKESGDFTGSIDKVFSGTLKLRSEEHTSELQSLMRI